MLADSLLLLVLSVPGVAGGVDQAGAAALAAAAAFKNQVNGFTSEAASLLCHISRDKAEGGSTRFSDSISADPALVNMFQPWVVTEFKGNKTWPQWLADVNKANDDRMAAVHPKELREQVEQLLERLGSEALQDSVARQLDVTVQLAFLKAFAKGEFGKF